MTDAIFDSFLVQQHREGLELAASSDLLELMPLEGVPGNIGPVPQRYIARFFCKGMVRSDDGTVTESSPFDVGIFFPSHYLRHVEPMMCLTWLAPRNVFHPNISDKAPIICVGRLTPGTPLVDILYQLYEIITYQKVTMREDDALNKEACAWARRHQQSFPIDSRPLKRRRNRIEMEDAT